MFSDGLEEDEYQDVDEQAIEKELMEEGIIPKPDKDESDGASSAAGATDEASEQNNLPHDFISDFLNQDDDQAEAALAILNLKRGRADLVAINTKGGPSYIFEFKYHRDSNARKETKYKVCRILWERAEKQIDFYVTDDRLSKLPNLHKYIVMYAYGKMIVKEKV